MAELNLRLFGDTRLSQELTLTKVKEKGKKKREWFKKNTTLTVLNKGKKSYLGIYYSFQFFQRVTK